MAEGAAERLPETLSAGTVIAQKYRLTAHLGAGGMGVVWAAQEIQTGAPRALKFLRPGADGPEDPDAVKRFLREARAAAAVRHPHVVAIHEVLQLPDGRPVMVMELLTGESLRQRLIREGGMSLEKAASILLPVASAVGAAHQQGIVHRDLKPDNIFLGAGPGASTVTVLDFGIAKVTRLDSSVTQSVGLTGTGEVMGTPNYMAPEQVFGERDVDHRCDVWALGVIMYECLTGILPTRAANIGQVFKLIVAGGIKPLDSVLPGTAPPVVELVHRMLARRRDLRPFDLNEVASLLGRYTTVTVPAFGAPPSRGSAGPVVDGQEPEALPNADETVRRAGTREDEPLRVPVSSPHAVRGRRLGRLTTLGVGTLAVSALVGESLLLWRANAKKAPQSAAAGAAPVVPRATGPSDGGADAVRTREGR
ncbi:MAG TPA: serine/threonine-protein kinase [Polyangia bacterium]|nr:serine/threonine-protein kinase [Polyangia bacterium]